jgi:hypothetical protein
MIGFSIVQGPQIFGPCQFLITKTVTVFQKNYTREQHQECVVPKLSRDGELQLWTFFLRLSPELNKE